MDAVVTAVQIALVFILLAVFAWGMKRIGGRRAPAGLVSVPIRAPLTGRASLTVATVAGKAYVLGVTEQQVTLLDVRDAAELQLDLTPDTDAPADGGTLAPTRPPDTLPAAILFVAARAKKAWAARRSANLAVTPAEVAAISATGAATAATVEPEAWGEAWADASATTGSDKATSAAATNTAVLPVPVKKKGTARSAKTTQRSTTSKAVTT